MDYIKNTIGETKMKKKVKDNVIFVEVYNVKEDVKKEDIKVDESSDDVVERCWWIIPIITFLFVILLILIIVGINDSWSNNYWRGWGDGRNSFFEETQYNNSFKIGFSNESNKSSVPLAYLTYAVKNYSREGYYRITLGNMSRFIMFECVNSTIEITKTTIGCIKDGNKN